MVMITKLWRRSRRGDGTTIYTALSSNYLDGHPTVIILIFSLLLSNQPSSYLHSSTWLASSFSLPPRHSHPLLSHTQPAKVLQSAPSRHVLFASLSHQQSSWPQQLRSPTLRLPTTTRPISGLPQRMQDSLQPHLFRLTSMSLQAPTVLLVVTSHNRKSPLSSTS